MEEPRSWVEEARAAVAVEGWRNRLARFVLREPTDAPTTRRMAFKPREMVWLGILVFAIVCGAGVGFVRALPRGGSNVIPTPSSVSSEVTSPIASASPTPSVVVYVTGAVRKPGVYEFGPGSRVIDALKIAGGPTPLADISVLNLAQPLADGERLYIPRRGETPPPELGGSGGSGTSPSGKINLNTATVAEMDAGIPGVGPVLAQRIVDYRKQHGPFHAIDDLRNVQGIGEKKFASIKDYVTV